MEKCFSAQCHKTVHGHNLLVVRINSSVCPWQAFPAWFNVCGLGQVLWIPPQGFTLLEMTVSPRLSRQPDMR
jgi:hypothetical protein